MKAAVLTAPRSIEIQDKAKPRINEQEVLVKLQYCGICTLEQRLYTGDRTIYFPIIPGHEASGVVVECESISLSRTIPVAFRWVVKPFIESVPRESLEAALRPMRDAFAKRSGEE